MKIVGGDKPRSCGRTGKMKNLRVGNKIRKALRGNSKGLTLVEIVIAMALIGIIAVAFLGGLSNAILALHFADVQATAESLARTAMEYEKAQHYEDAPWGPDESGYDGYTVTVSAEPVNDEDDGLQKITVIVSHSDKGIVKDIVTLTGYKRE